MFPVCCCSESRTSPPPAPESVSQINHDCYTCSYCTTVHNDAVDGTCPDTCDAFTTADPNADGTCHSHSECGHNGDTHTYCDSANTCYACDYCVK